MLKSENETQSPNNESLRKKEADFPRTWGRSSPVEQPDCPWSLQPPSLATCAYLFNTTFLYQTAHFHVNFTISQWVSECLIVSGVMLLPLRARTIFVYHISEFGKALFIESPSSEIFVYHISELGEALSIEYPSLEKSCVSNLWARRSFVYRISELAQGLSISSPQ